MGFWDGFARIFVALSLIAGAQFGVVSGVPAAGATASTGSSVAASTPAAPAAETPVPAPSASSATDQSPTASPAAESGTTVSARSVAATDPTPQDPATPSAAAETSTPAATSAPSPEPSPVSTPAAPATAPEATPTPTATPESTTPTARSLAVTPLSVPSGINAGLVCAKDTFYSVKSNGQLQKVAIGAVTAVGSAASGVSDFNGLGIGADGKSAYGYERSYPWVGGRKVAIWYFNGTGWVSTGDSFQTQDVDDFVTGAVNLATGEFLFGGFGNNRFYLYKYVPATGAFSTVGWVDTSSAGGGNGDMAFDAAGNLYLVGSGTTTTVYSITAATLAGATGGKLAASQSFSKALTGFSSINGMAFNTTGSMYLGNRETAREYNSSTWAQIGSDVTTGLGSSTDLASCNSPVNLTLKKNVTARVSGNDQFRLSIKSDTTESGTATTSGSATGVQAAQVGPLPVIGGSTYTVSETMASGSTSTMADYASTLVCTDENGATLPSTGGSVTMPTRSGASVVCTFTNAPLVANVTVAKTVQDINGQNPSPGAGWVLGAKTTATTGTATVAPTGATQTTPASGQVAWKVNFGTTASRATIAVSETQQTGWDFVSGTCRVTTMTGSTSTVTFSAATGGNVTGIAPGDTVACMFTNKPSSAKLTLVKKVDNTNGGSSVVSDWTLTATGPQTNSGKTGDPLVTGAVIKPGDYTLSESGTPTGYQASLWTCLNGTTPVTVTDAKVTLAANANLTCTITNASEAGSVTWTKTAEITGGLLGGSEWTITGPGFTAPNNVIKDCTAAPCSGLDKDPAAGSFRLENLKWGTYTATETLAPPGYVMSGTLTFTVSAANAGTTQNLGAQVNKQQKGAVLPLTGGLGGDIFLIAGGALLFISLALFGVFRLRRRTH